MILLYYTTVVRRSQSSSHQRNGQTIYIICTNVCLYYFEPKEIQINNNKIYIITLIISSWKYFIFITFLWYYFNIVAEGFLSVPSAWKLWLLLNKYHIKIIGKRWWYFKAKSICCVGIHIFYFENNEYGTEMGV